MVPVEGSSPVAVGSLSESGDLHSGLDPDGTVNGIFGAESHNVNRKHGKPIPLTKDNENPKRSNNYDLLESEDGVLSCSKTSKRMDDRYKMSQLSYSHDRYKHGVIIEGGSHERDSVKERSQSRGILAEDGDVRSKSTHRHEANASYHDPKHKNDYEFVNHRMDLYSEDWQQQRKNALRYETREESRLHSREREVDIARTKEEQKGRKDEVDRDKRNKNECERNMDREWERERDRKREGQDSSMNKVIDWSRRRDLERETRRDRVDGTRGDKERDRMIGGGRKERERDRSRDSSRGSERGMYGRREMKDKEKIREEERKLKKSSLDDRSSGRHRAAKTNKGMYETLKHGYGNKDRSKQSKNLRYDPVSHQDVTRDDCLVKVLEDGSDKQTRYFNEE